MGKRETLEHYEERALPAEYRDTLEPFGWALHVMLDPLRHYPTEDLEMLILAGGALTETNCWFRSYEIAPLLVNEARAELLRRKKAA